MAVSFDAETMIAKMRNAQEASLAEARQKIKDPVVLAFLEAQVAMAPAMECWVRLHISLREAGKSELFVAALAGILAGRIIDEVLLNVTDPATAFKVANQHAAQAIHGKPSFGSGMLSVPGQKAGRA